MHRFGPTGEATPAASCLIAARILSLIFAEPASTSRNPSGPIDAVMLLPSATSIYTLPCTGRMCTSPSLGHSAAILRSGEKAGFENGDGAGFAAAPFNF